MDNSTTGFMRKLIIIVALVVIAIIVLVLAIRPAQGFVFPVIIAFLCAGIGLGIFIGIKFAGKKAEPAPVSASEGVLNIRTIVKAVLPIAEFSSLVYHYTAVIVEPGKGLLKFTKGKSIYTMDGTIKLGFDARNINVDMQYNNIIVSMPKIERLSHEMYPETAILYDEKAGIFNQHPTQSVIDRLAAHKEAQEKKLASDAGLFTQARQSAESVFRPLLENIPDVKKGAYKVVFEWAPAPTDAAPIEPQEEPALDAPELIAIEDKVGEVEVEIEVKAEEKESAD